MIFSNTVTRLSFAATLAVSSVCVVAVADHARQSVGSASSIADLASQQKETGTIVGTVKNSDGEPAAKVVVSIYANSFGGRAGGGQGLASTPPPAEPLQSKGKSGAGRGNGKYGDPVAKAVTDDQGKYKVAKPLKAGYYRIEAGDRKTVGYRADSVEVKAGEETTKDLQLTKPQGGGGEKTPADGGGDDRRR